MKIFAFFGVDLDGYPDGFLERLYKDGYTLLSLDSKAIELASLSKIPYTVINDWLDTQSMLSIQKNAWYCENNWFMKARKDFISSGVCWPEFDHFAMNKFWLDVISSLQLAEVFRKQNIDELLIINQNEQIPVLYFVQGSVCKKLWEKELPDCINFLESKQKTNNIQKDDVSIDIDPASHLYSAPEILTDKIAFFASETELSRSNNAMLDLLTTFPEKIVIIPNEIPYEQIYHYKNKWSVPIIPVELSHCHDGQLSKKFSKGYQKTRSVSEEDMWEKSLNALNFHFLYYCQHRWPLLDNIYTSYLNLFSKNQPKVIIGSRVFRTEWQLPILAAQHCGIKSISIPHSVVGNTPVINVPQTLQELKFDYHLYPKPISKKILNLFCSIHEGKYIACKNCTDINSYNPRKIEPEYSQNSLKILVLFSPTSYYIYPRTKSRLIYPSFKNPRTQMTAIRILNSPPEDIKEKLSIKFKVHPGFSELELFNATGENTSEKLLPIDSELNSILNETDLVIGVNYYGSALFHALESITPFIFFNNDELFERSLLQRDSFFGLFDKSIKIVHTPDELWDCIRTCRFDNSLFTQMKSDVSLFSENFLLNSQYPGIGEVVQEVLKNDENVSRFTKNTCKNSSVATSVFTSLKDQIWKLGLRYLR